jgi:hypothetical protein
MREPKPSHQLYADPYTRRASLFSFAWKKDASGYDLSPDRQRIVRRMGSMRSFDPTAIDPPLYRTFGNLWTQVWFPDEDRTGYAEAGLTFHKRRFDDIESALLGFVREYGFLGSPGWGADASAEPLEYLMREQKDLSLLLGFGLENDAEGTPLDEQFNWFVPVMRPRLVKYGGHYQIVLAPETLLGWMYWRTGMDLCDGVSWDGPGCLHCEKPMGRGPGSYRSDAKFCSPKCRIYFYRRGTHKLRRRSKRTRRRPRTGKPSHERE